MGYAVPDAVAPKFAPAEGVGNSVAGAWPTQDEPFHVSTWLGVPDEGKPAPVAGVDQVSVLPL